MTTSPTRWTISVLAIAGTLPYLLLKVAWLSGSRIGLNDPDFGDSAVMYAANAITLVLDLAAIVLALALVTEWGQRIPAPWVLFPAWVGTGLLAPIVLLVPVQMAMAAGSEATAPQEQAIAGWVFTMVYSGFIWLGFFLLLGFVLHARERWGADWGRPVTRRAPKAVGIAVLGLLALSAVLETARVEDMTVVSFVGNYAFYAAAALALWLCSRQAATARWLPLVLGWVSSGALATWGLYGAVLLLVPNDLIGGTPVEPVDVVSQLVRTAAGLAVAVLVARSLRRDPAEERSALAAA